MLKTALPALIGCALVATVATATTAAAAPTEEQVLGFSTTFEKAWKARDIEAILATYEQDGLPEATLDAKAGYWERVIEYSDGTEWGGVKFMPLDEALKEHPHRNVAAYRRMVAEREINGRRYALNRPAVGFVTLYTQGKSGVIFAVGLDAGGNLRLLEHKPLDGVPLERPAPIPFPGRAPASPDAEAVERFTTAAREALAAKDLLPIFQVEGVPLDVLDTTVDQCMVLLNEEGMEVTKVTFYPANPGDLTVIPRVSEPMKQRKHWYGFSLPFVGHLSISAESKDEEHRSSGSLMMPVGVTPEGELRLISPTPVLPPGGE